MRVMRSGEYMMKYSKNGSEKDPLFCGAANEIAEPQL
jgi:hypothetical protein